MLLSTEVKIGLFAGVLAGAFYKYSKIATIGILIAGLIWVFWEKDKKKRREAEKEDDEETN